MSLLEAVVLGLIQGITEFLPISSTAHLRIVPALLGWDDPGAAYSAVIQLGTTAAVILYFARDLARLGLAALKALFAGQPFGTQDARLAWYVVLGTIPVAVLGVLLKKRIETSFRSLYVIAFALILLALVLLVVERVAQHKKSLETLGWKDALVVGLCQAVALIPGASRSGTTLTGALGVGLRREDAARFSFLLSVPATAAAGVFELGHLLKATDRPSTLALAVGTAVSFASGMLAIAGLLRFLRTHTTLIFVGYRVLAGGLLLALLVSGKLAAL